LELDATPDEERATLTISYGAGERVTREQKAARVRRPRPPENRFCG